MIMSMSLFGPLITISLLSFKCDRMEANKSIIGTEIY